MTFKPFAAFTAASVVMLSSTACNRAGDQSSLKDIAPATSVSDAQVSSLNNGTDAAAAVRYPTLQYEARGSMVVHQSGTHNFTLKQLVTITTSDEYMAFCITEFHTINGGSYHSNVDNSLKPQLCNPNAAHENVQLLTRATAASLTALAGTNPAVTGAEGAVIFISEIQSTQGPAYHFDPPVPYMALPSSAGSYQSLIAAPATFNTTITKVAAGKAGQSTQMQASVVVSVADLESGSITLRVVLSPAAGGEAKFPAFIAQASFPVDARYTVDTGNERLLDLWSKEEFSNGTTELHHQLCHSEVGSDATSEFSNPGCSAFNSSDPNPFG